MAQADREGHTEDAIRLHKASLEIKIRVCGEMSVQAALSNNELGECDLQTQKLDWTLQSRP